MTNKSHDRAVRGRLPKATLHEMLCGMLRIRLFEERAVSIHAASQMPGFVHIAIGQEAETVGACMAWREDGYLVLSITEEVHGIF